MNEKQNLPSPWNVYTGIAAKDASLIKKDNTSQGDNDLLPKAVVRLLYTDDIK